MSKPEPTQPELTWRNYPGIVGKGMEAAKANIPLEESPYPIPSPQHTAWIRGYVRYKWTERGLK